MYSLSVPEGIGVEVGVGAILPRLWRTAREVRKRGWTIYKVSGLLVGNSGYLVDIYSDMFKVSPFIQRLWYALAETYRATSSPRR